MQTLFPENQQVSLCGSTIDLRSWGHGCNTRSRRYRVVTSRMGWVKQLGIGYNLYQGQLDFQPSEVGKSSLSGWSYRRARSLVTSGR